jgi:RimJ/RimL family protein N-acetyltransferase
MSDAVRLRPVEREDVPLLDEWDRSLADEDPFDDFGFRVPGRNLRKWESGELLGKDGGILLVTLPDGTVIGDVSYRRVAYGGPPSDAWNIGVALRPEFRGRGYGTAAQAALCDYLFATTAVNRIEASTDVENVAERRALAKAGFTEEGILRGAQFRAGRFHDLVGFSRLRSDPAPGGRTEVT